MVEKITVEFYTGVEPLVITGVSSNISENLVIAACKYLGIGPVGRHLFGMWNFTQSLWYPPNHEFHLNKDDSLSLFLRMRFVPHKFLDFEKRTDEATLNYIFHQVHSDFVQGRIPELCSSQCYENILGLVASDIIRVILETNSTPSNVKYRTKNYLPSVLRKNFIWDNFIKEPLQKAVLRGWSTCRRDTNFVKSQYIEGLYALAPDYSAEKYSVLVDSNGKIYQEEIFVQPHHEKYPGIRMRTMKQKDSWYYVCALQELCYVSIRGDHTVEISRQNGFPIYVQFRDEAHMLAFVSLLDGYYRLAEKWTFNLCKDLTSPSLTALRAMKCHGPVGTTFAYKKLKEKSKNEEGCYLLRESEDTYDEYIVDMWMGSKSSTILVIYKEDDKFTMIGHNESFTTITELLADYASSCGELHFNRCIPPSEYDKPSLLLCRRENQDEQNLVTRGDCSCVAQCIPHDAVIYKQKDPVFDGTFTLVSMGYLRRSCSTSCSVAVKMLRKETKVAHLQEFLSQCDKILYWQHDNIVSTIGMILSNPTALVMEYLALGTLDKYLETHRDTVQEVDLIEAAFYIARALWYIEDQRTSHGKIRCCNILVAAHNEGCFKVKLGDPGIISYTDMDIPWIPPECYHNYSEASRSISADVYAYGTTLWEIFSYGAKPNHPVKVVKERYLKGYTPSFPIEWHKDVKKIISECWLRDPDNRKRPQAIVRDVNQNLYEVYNCRRGHSYATIDNSAVPVQEESPTKPPLPVTRPPVKESSVNKLKNIFKWSVSSQAKGIPYNALSQSKSTLNTNASSTTSTVSFVLDESSSSITPVNSISYSEPESYPYMNHFTDDYSWVIEGEHLNILGKIGEGFYGEVSKATLNFNGFVDKTVAVKRIKMNNQSPICVNELKREMQIMKNLKHRNIVRFIGLVEDPETMLVMEYVDNGSLLNHLQCSKNMKSSLNYEELLRFSLGVAEGMEYLETQSVVHRDLAARNILVGSENKIKISDFGLAQVIKDHYYRMTTERNLPVRWYAIEAIMESKFSHKSDVWSYGIVLWEIFSFGENPQIPDVPDISLHEALQRGKRLTIPNKCPSSVYCLMRRCWDKDSHERPSFSEIITTLNDIQLGLCS